MTKQSETHRAVEATDLEVVERAIKDHEVFQRDLFTLQRILTEVGKLDVAGIRGTAAAEQARCDEARKQADAEQARLEQLQQDIASKQRALADVEATIKERITEGERYNSAMQNLRDLLRVA
jgi:ribosomal protein S18